MLKKYLVPFLISLLFFFAYTQISLEMYRAHQTRGDLTAYAQGMWNTLHGNFMASTYNYSVHNYYDREFREITPENSNIFGIHFNPILLTVLPLYALAPSPPTLLLIQAFSVAGGGFLMYLLATKILKHQWLAILIEFSYLLYFATVSAVLSQFHAYTLALFFAPLLLLTSRLTQSWLYYLSLGLFLLVQENTSLAAALFGIYLLFSPVTRNRGVVTFVTSVLYFLLVIYHAIPALSPYHFYLFSGIYGTPLGVDIRQIILSTLSDPRLFVQTILTPVNLTYLSNLLLGIAPFALLSPAMLLIGFSALAQNILSSSLALKDQQMHYESGSVAFLFYALILGISFFLTKTKIGKSQYALLITLTILFTATVVSYKQFTSLRLNPSMLRISLYTERNREMDSQLALIPNDASVSTQDYLSAQLANRPGLYQFPIYADRADYLLLAKDEAVWPLTKKEHDTKLLEIRNNPAYQINSETAYFVLFKRVK